MNKKVKLNFFDLWHSAVLRKLRNKFDKGNMFKSISHFPRQIVESFDIESRWYKKNKKNLNIISNNINSVLICGMGGSAIGGELAKVILSEYIKVPILINRSNTIPDWINKKTLVIISSYSGNTYETIQAFHSAIKKTDKIISISSNSGTINDYCLKNNYSIINIPFGLKPRCALGYISSMIILILSRLNLVNSPRKVRLQLKQSVGGLNDINKLINSVNNPILSMSFRLRNTIPVIYGSEDLTSVAAVRFKNQLQENAKVLSFHNNFPEINHNEIEGWIKKYGNFYVLWLIDSSYDLKIKNTLELSYELLQNSGVKQETLSFGGDNRLARLYKLIFFLDWVSYYLALLNNIDPSPVNNIQYIKEKRYTL